jgi:hypothetical protein
MRLSRASFLKLCSIAAALSCFCCAFLAAQDKKQEPEKNATRIPPPAVEISSPFELDAAPSQRVNSIEFRSESAMDASDREAASDAMPSITAKSAVQGLDLSLDKWSYRQIVCPVLPQHVFLLFERNNGAHDLSMFSAVIPRNGKGSVLILPIMHRGYSLYTHAPSNPMSISAFNDILAHEKTGRKIDWLTTGLCYAALSGNQVVLSRPTENPAKDTFTFVSHPSLAIGDGSVAVVRFLDVAVPQRPKEWELTFDRNGKLLTVATSIVPVPKATVVP